MNTDDVIKIFINMMTYNVNQINFMSFIFLKKNSKASKINVFLSYNLLINKIINLF